MLTYGGGGEGGGGGSGLLSSSISYSTSKVVPNLLHNKQTLGGGGGGLAQEKELTILRNQVRATLLAFRYARLYLYFPYFSQESGTRDFTYIWGSFGIYNAAVATNLWRLNTSAFVSIRQHMLFNNAAVNTNLALAAEYMASVGDVRPTYRRFVQEVNFTT
jgi:hypothetical protein